METNGVLRRSDSLKISDTLKNSDTLISSKDEGRCESEGIYNPKKTSKNGRWQFGILAMLAIMGPLPCRGGVIGLSQAVPEYVQDFNSLVVSGSVTWFNDSTLPGWYASATGVWDGTLNASTGASTGGDIYSFGLAGNVERAIGSLASGTIANPFYGARFSNAGNTDIVELSIEYSGEEWRNSGNVNVQSLLFEYRIGGTAFDNTGWLSGPSSLDFASPVRGGSASALNGNLAANRLALQGTLANVAIAPGSEFWFRWYDPNDVGNDHALAVDDLRVAASFAPPPSPSSGAPGASAPEPMSLIGWTAGLVTLLAVRRQRRCGQAQAMN